MPAEAHAGDERIERLIERGGVVPSGVNQCDEISREESERVNWCELACNEANMYSDITPPQKVCFLFGLLLLVLSGTICLNFYREAIKCPPKLCSPWYREVPGRVLLCGSVTWAIGLLIWIITQLCELATGGRLLGGGDDFVYAVVFVCIMVFNLALVASSWVGRCCLAEDTAADEASSRTPSSPSVRRGHL